MRKPFIILLMATLLPSAAIVTAAAETPLTAIEQELSKNTDTLPPTQTRDSLDKILSGDETLPLVTAPELEEGLDKKIEAVARWFSHHRHTIFIALVGCTVSILLGLCAGWVVRRYLPVNAAITADSLQRELAAALLPPFILLLVVLSLFGFLVPVLNTMPELYRIDARFFFTVATLIAAWAIYRLIQVMSLRLCKYAQNNNNNLDILMVQITRKFLVITLVIMTILFIGQSILELNITTLLAGAGVVGLAVAFASRETLSNFFGTLVIILDHPFRIGDRIQVGGIDGIVEAVGMRSTRIRTGNESVYTIPNSKIAESDIENISSRGYIRYLFTLGLLYEAPAEDIERAIKLLHDVTDNFHGKDTQSRAPRIFFDSFGDSGLNIKVIMWFKTISFDTEEKWRTEINTAIFRRFNEENIGMAYNTVTNYLKFDPAEAPVKSVPAAAAKQQ